MIKLEKMGKVLIDTLPKNLNKHMEICLTLLVIWKMKFKNTMGYDSIANRIAEIQKQTIWDFDKGVEELQTSCAAGGNVKNTTPWENPLVVT